MTKFNEWSISHLKDYTFACDICGQKCWASKSHKLAPETGRGGLRVCPSCNDPIDFGIVPYKIGAEVPVPWARDAYHTNDLAYFNPYNVVEFDYELQDPMSAKPSPPL